MKKRLSPMDAVFVHLESRECPQQTAGLFTFSLPEDASPLYLRELFQRMRSFAVSTAPFNQVLSCDARIDRLLPALEILPPERIDIDYHFRHSALAAPGGEVGLGMLVSRLYSIPLDMSRPLWEVHLIEGLENRRFGLFLKMHHALMDGMAGIKMILSWLSDKSSERNQPPIWAAPREPRKGGRKSRTPVNVPQVAQQVSQAVGETWAAARSGRSDLTAPYSAPRSILNQRITQRRRISTQSVAMDRIKSLSKKPDITINDVALVIIGTALRRYLAELSALPKEPLVGGILVSTKPKDHEHVAGNAISFMFSTLGTDLTEVLDRVQAIGTCTRNAKQQLQNLSLAAINAYTALFMAPYVFSQLLQRGHLIKPMHSLSISNLHGPRQQTYFSDAPLEAFYPATVIAHGQALMIALMSCHDRLCFSFVTCPDVVPHSQRLAVYTADAVDELEAAARG